MFQKMDPENTGILSAERFSAYLGGGCGEHLEGMREECVSGPIVDRVENKRGLVGLAVDQALERTKGGVEIACFLPTLLCCGFRKGVFAKNK
jgi:hypothetical protein